MTTKKHDLTSKSKMIAKAQAICEAKYQEANENRALGLKKAEQSAVNKWIAMAEAFAELFEMEEDEFLGITS